MAEMKCPYDEITLKLALLGLESKMADDTLANKINARLSDFLISDKAEMNQKIAKHNGIEVVDLINSPNYTTLKEEFSQTLLLKAISILKEETFTDKEAWALVAVGTGTLKI